MNNCSLPDGFTERPATLADAEALTAMLNCCSTALMGVEKHFVADLRSEWGTPGFNLATDTRLAIAPNGQIVGYVEVWDTFDPHVQIHIWAQTHPGYRGLGIGAYLNAWGEQRARQAVAKAPPQARVILMGFALTIDEAARQLLQDCGFEIARYSLRMRIDLDEPPAKPVWPEGIVTRPMRVGCDERAIAIAVRESFRDHWGYVERPLEQDVDRWMHRFHTDPFLNPKLFFIAWDGDQPAGISLCYDGFYDDHELGWVSTLGVLRPWRRRGLGLALLQHSFGALYAIGRRRVGLGVDALSLTGATRLYERAGMHSDPQRRFANFHKELRPGVELGTQEVHA